MNGFEMSPNSSRKRRKINHTRLIIGEPSSIFSHMNCQKPPSIVLPKERRNCVVLVERLSRRYQRQLMTNSCVRLKPEINPRQEEYLTYVPTNTWESQSLENVENLHRNAEDEDTFDAADEEASVPDSDEESSGMISRSNSPEPSEVADRPLSPTNVGQLRKIVKGCRSQMDLLVQRQEEMYRRLERKMVAKLEKQKAQHQRELMEQRRLLLKRRNPGGPNQRFPSFVKEDSVEVVSSTTPATPPPNPRPSSATSISSVAPATPAPPTPSRKCCLCMKNFRGSNGEEYRVHLLKHFDKVTTVCCLCGVDCGLNKFMKDHFMIAHGGLVKLVCEGNGCGRAFWTRGGLERHRATSHS